MISLSALLTSLGVMSGQQNQNANQQQQQPGGANNQQHINPHQNGGNGAGGIAAAAALAANNQNPAAEGSMERGSCLLRYASQNSLDESSQKHIQRPNSKDRCVGQYHNELHTTRSFEAMNEMRKQNLLCDVTLIAEDIEIPAHKMVLASCSPYFYAMFTGFEESRQGRITLQGVDHHALELLIEYVYTSTVEVNEDNVQVLLTAANLLQLTDVRDACCDYLQTQLDASNCLGIRDFADMHGCVDLVNYAEQYIEQHFNEVIQFDEFLNLTWEQVISLIRNDRISVASEEKVYESVVNWIRYDPTMRDPYTADLMEHVRLPLLSKEYITQNVDKEPLLEGNIICKNLIIEALTYHLLPNEIKTQRTIPRKPVGFPKILLVIGGQAPKAIRSVECYDLREEKWYQAAEMPNRRCRAGLAVLGDKVYAVGGFNGSLRVRTVDVYDPATDQWSTSNSMEARRSTLGVAVLNGCIYAVGGFDGTTGLCSAEVYDPKNEVWRFIASMSTRRSSVGVGVVNGLLYAVGGYDGFTRQCLSSVERYNPETDTWYQIADMSARRSGAGVGVLKNILYAVGGHDGPMVRKSVEAYDPETNQWHSVADMSFCRRNAGVVAHDGLLFVVGGDDGDSNLSSVEVYSPETDTWRILTAAMTIGRSYAGVCMIDKPIQATVIASSGLVDDENSQAEGTIEGAAVFVRQDQSQPQQQQNNNPIQQQQQQQVIHPHYENIYESIEQYNAAARGGAIIGAAAGAAANGVSGAAAAAAVALAPNNAANNVNAPAEEIAQQQQPNLPLSQAQQPSSASNENANIQNKSRLATSNINYRNDLYDRANAININSGNGGGVTGGIGCSTNYDIPRSVRSGLGMRRNFQLDLHAANPRFNAFRCNGVTCNHYTATTSSSSCHRQRSFDDTESQNYYNLNYQPSMRYENIYEQIHDEPIYRTANGNARVYGRLNVIGHGIGRIERHLSSSCGNIDHYNLGGHMAVLGHSHYGTVGHIRLNTGSTATTNSSSITSTASCNGSNYGTTSSSSSSAQKDVNNVKNSASSFFSCLHGENTQSMSNIYKASGSSPASATNGINANNIGTGSSVSPNSSKDRESRAASAGPLINPNANGGNESPPSLSSRPTGAIPKIKALNLGSNKNNNNSEKHSNTSHGTEKSVSSLKQALTKKSSSTSGSAHKSAQQAAASASISSSNNSTITEQSNSSSVNRISKSSLQWLLVNKWLPLWMGQGADCKVIDFNFMFSRDCVDCDAASAAAQMTNPYGTPRLSGLPQDIVRFNARAEMHATPTGTYRRQTTDGSTPRPLHNTLNRLRESDAYAVAAAARRYEDPSYENVHVHWQNGFEFGRSRDYDHSVLAAGGPYQSPASSRAPLQRARSESPTLHQRNNTQARRLRCGNNSSNSTKYKDPFRNYELNTENNTFKPKLAKADTVDVAESQAAKPMSQQCDSSSRLAPNPAPSLAAASLDDLEGAVGGAELMTSNENNSGATSSNLLANETAPLADASNPSPSECDNISVMSNGNSTKANVLNNSLGNETKDN